MEETLSRNRPDTNFHDSNVYTKSEDDNWEDWGEHSEDVIENNDSYHENVPSEEDSDNVNISAENSNWEDWGEHTIESSNKSKINLINQSDRPTARADSFKTPNSKGLVLSGVKKISTNNDISKTKNKNKTNSLGDEYDIKINSNAKVTSCEPDYFADMIPTFKSSTVIIEKPVQVDSKFQALGVNEDEVGGISTYNN